MMKYGQKSEVCFNPLERETWYLFGVAISDGNVNRNKGNLRFSLLSKDYSWLLSIRDKFFPNATIHSKGNGKYVVQVCNAGFCEWLIDHGCTERKSLTLELKNVPNIYMADVIRGYFDGDGCISKRAQKKKKFHDVKSYNLSFITASSVFANQIADILKTQNIDFSVYMKAPKNRKNIYNEFWIKSASQVRFIEWLYYDGFPKGIVLERKHMKALDCLVNRRSFADAV